MAQAASERGRVGTQRNSKDIHNKGQLFLLDSSLFLLSLYLKHPGSNADRFREVKQTFVSSPLHAYAVQVKYILTAVLFVAEHGAAFLPLYRPNIVSGEWTHLNASTSVHALPG